MKILLILFIKSGTIIIEVNKIESDKKIVGLAGLKIKAPVTCSDENLYAFTGEKEAHIVNTEIDNYSLGKTYQELYPYQDWMGIFAPTEMLKYYSDKRVKIFNLDYLKFEGKDLLVKGIYPKTLNDNEENYLLVGEDNILYTLIFTMNNDNVQYDIKKESKKVKEIVVSSSDDEFTINIQYTDGTNEKIEKLYDYNFIGEKK